MRRTGVAVGVLLVAFGLLLAWWATRTGDEGAQDAAREPSDPGAPTQAGGDDVERSGLRTRPVDAPHDDAAEAPAEPGSVRGRLRWAVASPNGKATVRVHVNGILAVEEEVPEGDFEIRYRRSGRSTLRIEAAGVRAREWSLSVAAADLGEVVLTPALVYGGRVLSRGWPVEGVWVQLLGRDDRVLGASQPTGRDGRYWIELDGGLPLFPDEHGRLHDESLFVWRDVATSLGPYLADVAGFQGTHDLDVDESTARFQLVRDDPKRTPVARASITISRASYGRRSAPWTRVASGRTDGGGHFSFPRLPWMRRWVARVEVPDGETFDLPLETWDERTPRVFVVSSHSIVDVRVQVEDERGSAVGDAAVGLTASWVPEAFPTDDGPPSPDVGTPLELRGRTDTGGAATWRVHVGDVRGRLRPGRWSVQRSETRSPEHGELSPKPVHPRSLVIRLGERLPRSIPVRVVEGEAQLPVAPVHATLRLFHSGAPHAGGPLVFSAAPERSESGEEIWRVSLPEGVPEALDSRLMFDAPVLILEVAGRVPRRVPLRIRDLTEGSRRGHVAVLRVPRVERSESVRVVDAGGKPADGALVAFAPRDPTADGTASVVRGRAGADGVATIADLEPGVDYRVLATSGDGEQIALAASWNADRGRVLRMRRLGAGFDLTVLLPDGSPASEAVVLLEPLAPGLVPHVRRVADRRGRVALPPIEPTLYRARIEARDPAVRGSRAPHVAVLQGEELRGGKVRLGRP